MEEQDVNKIKVGTKVNTGTKVAIGISILAIVVAGGGLLAEFSGAFTPRLSRDGPASRIGGSPSAFSLLSPANGAVDQDDSVTLTWEAATELESVRKLDKTSPTWSFIKPAKATHATMTYEVHFGPTATGTVNVAQVTSRSYTVTSLAPGTEYTWKIVARTGHGTRASNETWTFTTAGADFISGLGYLPDDDAAACGGNRGCDADNVLSCEEFNDVWLICNGIGNRCPDNLAGQCLQMSLCQCSGIPAGSDACTTYLSTFTDPCTI